MRISDWSSDVFSSDLELLGIRKTAQCGHAIGESDVLGSRLTAHGACSRLRVLLAQDARDVAGCEAELGELIRLQPYAHGVVSRAEQAGIADAGDSLELVDDVEQSVVAHEQTVVTFVGRREGDQRQADRKRTRMNSSHSCATRMPSSA